MFTTHRFKQLALRTIAVAFPLTVALSIPMATSANELRCENLRPSAGVTTGEEDGHTAFYGTRGDDIVCGLGSGDLILGGDGRDTIMAGGGFDRASNSIPVFGCEAFLSTAP